jgi:hypothetical protein
MKLGWLILFSILSANAWAWGGRGHHTICSAAVFLVKDEGLRDFLKNRPHMMGHLCNVPDFYWKSLGGDVAKLGNPAHFIDVEITGLKVSDVPLDYKKMIHDFTGKPNHVHKEKTIFSVPAEFGSLWWRADQFFRRATSLEKDWKKATPPANSKEEQDDNLAYNKDAFEFIVNLGLMGHFVGDASQPFHASVDYDGYMSGHGGIHAFYEDAAVSAIGPQLELRIVEAGEKFRDAAAGKDKEAKKAVPFLTAKTVIEKMKALSEISVSEVPAVLAIDPVKKPSEVKAERGMEIRTPAQRDDIKTVAAKFEPMIIQQMARSASLLATLWDEAYVKVGKPKLTAYKSYKYPFTPEFVVPDYIDDGASKK